jgi:hypothetical protein
VLAIHRLPRFVPHTYHSFRGSRLFNEKLRKKKVETESKRGKDQRGGRHGRQHAPWIMVSTGDLFSNLAFDAFEPLCLDGRTLP